MTPTFNSRNEADVKSCEQYEANRWQLDLATFPEDDDGYSEDDKYLTWTIRRYKRRWTLNDKYPEADQRAAARLEEVHEYFQYLRENQNWKFEKPLIATATYFVKRVVI